MDTNQNPTGPSYSNQSTPPVINPNVPQYGQPKGPRSSTPMIAIVALVIVAVIAGLYFWGQSLDKEEQALDTATEEGSNADLTLSADASTEVDDIEQDLDSQDVENSDKELEEIDSEF